MKKNLPKKDEELNYEENDLDIKDDELYLNDLVINDDFIAIDDTADDIKRDVKEILKCLKIIITKEKKERKPRVKKQKTEIDTTIKKIRSESMKDAHNKIKELKEKTKREKLEQSFLEKQNK